MTDSRIDPRVETYIAEDRGVWALSIQCPNCGRVHHHGGGLVTDGPPVLGHRAPHCGGGGGYTLVAGPADMPEPVGRRRRKGVHDVTGSRN